ncbi:TonB dependent receptor [Sphingomonas carotinifaciens]|nr:TonB dependent receptor [Sphingomonas carotinifaciens]
MWQRWLLLGSTLGTPVTAFAQDAPSPGRSADEIVITGERQRNAVITDAKPVGMLDEAAIRALGVTKISDLLRAVRGLTTSNSGEDPILLLNSRRISGWEEMSNLPPEAIERVDILPEPVAIQFGYPPTRRVMNIVTKAKFRAVTVEQTIRGATDGGALGVEGDAGSTVLQHDRRWIVAVNASHRDGLTQRERSIRPDPDLLYDPVGTVTGIGGGSIDPELDRLAGRPVTRALVPLAAAMRSTLAGYVPGATASRSDDPLGLRSIAPAVQRIKVNTSWSDVIGKSITASAQFTVEAERQSGTPGYAAAAWRVPGGAGGLPFANDVLLYRYLEEAGPLPGGAQSLKLSGGATVQGTLGDWNWNMTGTIDRLRNTNLSARGFDPVTAEAAIAAGVDPFGAGIVRQSGPLLIDRTRGVTRTITGKAVANGPLLRLPAGKAMLTASLDYANSSGTTQLLSAGTNPVDRTIHTASIGANLPIASAREGALAAIGELSANGTVGVSKVSGYGSLLNASYGLLWSPWSPVQFTASVSESRTPPPIEQLVTPAISLPGSPFFDFVTGTTALVTTVFGGNPTLAPEQRRINTLGVDIKPWKRREVRFGVNLTDTVIEDQAMTLSATTPAIQAAFPDRFRRNAAGQLIAADLRPLNLARGRQRALAGRIQFHGPLGAAPPPPPEPAPGAPPPPPPKPRLFVYGNLTPTLILSDRLRLRSGLPELDLLAGETITGSGGRPRIEGSGWMGANYRGFSANLWGRYQSATQVRGAIPGSDLQFSGLFVFNIGLLTEIGVLAPNRAWAKGLTFNVQVENVANQRQDVRDALGATPYRFQRGFLDPIGRSVQISLRKLF